MVPLLVTASMDWCKANVALTSRSCSYPRALASPPVPSSATTVARWTANHSHLQQQTRVRARGNILESTRRAAQHLDLLHLLRHLPRTARAAPIRRAVASYPSVRRAVLQLTCHHAGCKFNFHITVWWRAAKLSPDFLRSTWDPTTGAGEGEAISGFEAPAMFKRQVRLDFTV